MDDEIYDRLAMLDPTRVDDPPSPDSDRFRKLKENAMNTLTETATLPSEPAGTPGWGPRRRRVLQVAAAVIATVVGVTVVITGTDSTSAAAVVSQATRNLDSVESARGTLTQLYPDGEVWTFEGELVGADSHQRMTQRRADGTVLSTSELILIDDIAWTVRDGVVDGQKLAPEERLGPFASSQLRCCKQHSKAPRSNSSAPNR